MTDKDALPYAVVQRLRLIDVMLMHYNSVNRGMLVDYFGISTVQASHDLQLYQTLAPGNMAYDLSGKTYRRKEGFSCIWPCVSSQPKGDNALQSI